MQIESLKAAIVQANGNFENWRATMPLMRRLIFVRFAVQGRPPLGGGDKDKDKDKSKDSTGTHGGDLGKLGAPALEAIVPAKQAVTWAREAESVARKVGDTRASAVAAVPMLAPDEVQQLAAPSPSEPMKPDPSHPIPAVTSLTLQPREPVAAEEEDGKALDPRQPQKGVAAEISPQTHLRRVPQKLPDQVVTALPTQRPEQPLPDEPKEEVAARVPRTPPPVSPARSSRGRQSGPTRKTGEIDGIRFFPKRQEQSGPARQKVEIDGIRFLPSRTD
jgi:hypothetical protein